MNKIYKQFLVAFILFLIIPFNGFATHIVGGALTYTYNGGNNYTVMLKLYRDCTGAAFPGSAPITVLQANGSLFAPDLSFTLLAGLTTSITPVLPPCATSPSVVPCAEERIYTATVTIPPSPGGVHMYYGVCCRNGSIVNITTPGTVGETFYAYIPCYNLAWSEDFTLANGTTVDAGPTAWSTTVGATSPTSMQVNNGQFEFDGANNGQATWVSQIINISSFASGVNLSANVSRAGTMEGGDQFNLWYSINSGPLISFAVNGTLLGNFASPVFAKSTGLVGNTIQIYARALYNNNSPASEIYRLDMVNVYDNTFLPNSNPSFSQLPPLLFCQTNGFSINHSATDLDGDVLVYSMYTPYIDAPAPTFPNNIASIPPVTWVAGYSSVTPFNSGGPNVNINPGTGLMTGVANSLGRYVFGVKCSEYRNSILLSETTRDYQITTVVCPPFVPSAPIAGAGSNTLCAGQTLNLTASFTAGATYSWTGPNSFTSNIQNPTIVGTTTAAAGVYSVSVTIGGCTGPPGTTTVVVNPIPSAPVAGGNTPVCEGQTLNLTASFTAGATYNWSGPNGFTSTNQNPTIAGITLAGAGTYSVNATMLGCTGADGSTVIVVNPTPAAPTAGSNAPLCAGQTLNLTSTFSAATTYSWAGPNTFTSNVQNPSIAGITIAGSGIYSVSATSAGCTGPIGTVSVTVNNAPSAPAPGANTPLCEGSTLNLTSTFTAGVTYNWSGPNAFTSTNQNPSIAGITVAGTGIYSVNATLGGCAGPTGTISVTVNPSPSAPVANANTPLCTGLTLSLTSTFTAGATYNWSGPNGFSSALQNPTIAGATPAATGLYSVTATVAGCTGPVGTISVNVSTPPVSPVAGGNTPLCVGQTLNLTATFTAGLTYSWSGPNTFTSNLQNPSIAAITLADAGTYSVFATTAGGCSGPIGTILVAVNPSPSAPTAGANAPLCAGQTLNLTSTFTAGATYNWSGPNTFISNVQNPSIAAITIAGSGVYSVNATVAGCPGPSGTISVIVNPIPVAPTAGANTPLCVGQTLNLTSTFSAGATYNWSGPNGFSSIVQNPSIVAVTLLASGTYSVTQTLLGCTGAAGVIAVTVNPIPASPTITTNAPICALQTLSLNANPVGSTYSWTGPNSFTSTLQNPTIASTSTLDAGTYSVTQTLLGCTSSAASIVVVINQAAPTPTAISNSPICLSQNINLSQTAIVGATYSWSGPNGFTSVVQNPTIISPPITATGVYSVFATVAGCAGQTTTLSILVSSPGTVTAVSPTVCANNALVALNGTSSTGSGTWTSSGAGIFAPNALNGNYTPSAAEIATGSATLTLTSTNNGGCLPITTTTSILITPAPTSSAGSNQTVCANNATVSLSGSVTIASGGSWSSSGTGTFVPNNNVLNASYVPSAADIASGSFTLSLSTTGNGNCISVIDSKVITISPAPVVNTGPSPQVVCKNNPNFQLNGSSTTGSGVWASSGTGTFSASNNILNPTYFPSTADTLAGIVTLTLTSTNNGGCNLVSQTMSIVYVSTLAVNPGTNQVVCANNATVSLSGISTTSAGIWTSSGTGTFSPSANLLVTNYIPSPADILAGVVTLTLTTANNGGCNPISNAMTITITPGPTANAGVSQTVCANSATTALTGSFTIASGGIWSSSGTGTFTPNNTSMNTSYIASSADTTAGSVIITLSTTNNGNCFASTNTLVINYTPAPLVIPGANISVCKTNANAVLNGYSSTGSGTWTSSGTGTFSPINAVLNPTYTPSTADTTAGSVILTLTSMNNGGCNSVTQSLTITYSGIPTVTAGLSQTVCANNSTVVLTGTASTGSGTWTSSGTGTFSPNAQNGNYVPSALDITAGVVTLTITSTNNGGCLAVAQQMTVNFSPSPQVNAGVSQTLCSNTSSINLSGSFSVATGGIWSSSGSGTFTPNNTNMIVSYIPTSADTAAGNVTIYLISTGNGNCLQVIDSVKINFIQAPFALAGADISLCPYSSNPILTGSTSVASFTWSTSGSGSFSPNNTILNPVYIPSAGDNSAGTVTLTLLTGTATCGSAADTLVVSFKPKPVSAFTYTNRCIGASTSFTDVSLSMTTGSVVSWYWHFDTDTSTIQNPVYTFTSSGSHTVTLLVSNGSCVDSIVKPFFVNPKPSPGFTFTTMCHDSVKFVQTSTVSPGGISNWNWDFGDVTTSVIQNPYHTYADTGMYIVSLFVKSDSNCTASIIDTVHVVKCANDIIVVIGEPAVPSGFTPNGDGSNDVLFVKGGPFNNLDFRIFNEWGNQIFRSDIQSTGWDGTYKSADQPGGRFIWTVNGELIDGRKVKMAGEVILNR